MYRLSKYVLILIFIALLPVGTALADTLTVTTTSIEIVSDSQCSIREAVTNANNDAQTYTDCPTGNGADIIELGGQTVLFTDWNKTVPHITTDITIQNGTLTRISSWGRFLYVAGTGTLTVDNMALTNGGEATIDGGAIYGELNSTINVSNSVITGNLGYDGGAIYGEPNSTINVSNSILNNNNSTRYASAIWSNGILIIDSSTVQGNQSGNQVTIASVGGTFYIMNSLITGNESAYGLAGIGSSADTTTDYITNSIIAGNRAISGTGGGVYKHDADLYIVNSIIYGNSSTSGGADIHHGSTGATYVSYSIYGSVSGITDSGNNSTSDPLFTLPVAASSAPTTAGDYTLQSGSPARDAGNNSADPDGGGSLPIMSDLSWTDLNGDTRIRNSTIDIGAYEFTDPCAGITFPYTLPDNAPATLRTAIECANANATDDTIDLNGQTVTLTDSYADYSGNTGLPQIATVMTLQNGTLDRSGANQFRFLSVNSTGDLTLDTMTVNNGGGTTYNAHGGAVDIEDGTLTVVDSVFFNNTSVIRGGVINADTAATVNIDGSRFSYNTAGDKTNTIGIGAFGTGGAILIRDVGSVLTIVDSIFEGNAALVNLGVGTGRGGALNIRAGAIGNVSNSLFIGNYAGLWAASGTAHADSSEGGAIMAMANADLTITNSTFANNYGNRGGGAVGLSGATTTVNFNNSIAYGNWDEAANEDLYNIDGTLNSTSSLYGVANGTITDGGGNIVATDPLFINPTGDTSGNYRVQDGSPVIDTGNDTLANNASLTTDIEGNNRFVDGDMLGGTEVDMGAYEFQGTATISGTITDDLGGNMEFVDVRVYISGTNSLLGSTCTDGVGDYSIDVGYTGDVDVNVGGVLAAQSGCSNATDFYNLTSQLVSIVPSGSYGVNLAITPNKLPIALNPTAPTGLQTTQLPTFNWPARQGANSYQILIEEIAGSYTDTLNVTEDSACAGAVTCSYTLVGGEEIPYSLGNFRAFVRSANSVGNSAYGGAIYFQISPAASAPASAPTINAPLSGAITGLTPTLEWTTVADASHYQLYIYYGASSSSILTLASGDASCAATCSTVVAVPEGYNGFNVRAVNAAGSTAWSTARGFVSTAATAVPADVILTSPVGTVSTTTTTIEWLYEQYVDRYAIYVTPPGIGSSVFENNPASTYCPVLTPGATCSTNISTPTSGTYNVQLIARNLYGYGNWFNNPVVVDLAPDSILSAPTWLSDTMVRTDRSFPLAWSEVEGAISYTLVMYNPRGISEAQVYNTSVCSAGICTVIYDVDTNGLYAAYVQATGISSASAFALSSFPVRLLDAPSVGLPIVDADNDGIDDSFDNCTTVANAEQLDRDGDGIGAACDWNDSPDTMPSVGNDDDTNPNDGGRGLPGAPSNP